jgi:hypothetical protein
MYSKLHWQYCYDSGNKSRQELSESVPRDAAGEGMEHVEIWQRCTESISTILPGKKHFKVFIHLPLYIKLD